MNIQKAYNLLKRQYVTAIKALKAANSSKSSIHRGKVLGHLNRLRSKLRALELQFPGLAGFYVVGYYMHKTREPLVGPRIKAMTYQQAQTFKSNMRFNVKPHVILPITKHEALERGIL